MDKRNDFQKSNREILESHPLLVEIGIEYLASFDTIRNYIEMDETYCPDRSIFVYETCPIDQKMEIILTFKISWKYERIRLLEYL